MSRKFADVFSQKLAYTLKMDFAYNNKYGVT